MRRPMSRLYHADRMPPQPYPPGDPRARDNCGGTVQISCSAHCHPLDVCVGMGAGLEGRRVAMVHFTGVRDSRNEATRYTHFIEDQLFLRTTYFQCYEKLGVDIDAPVGMSIDQGGLIYTPGVGILRGPLQEGALWLVEPPRADVIWVGLRPPRPPLAEQGQYADERDRLTMASVIDRIFALAAANEVDTLVLPPLGCGTHGCHHPALDVADMIHDVAHRYGQHIQQVVVASDCPMHFRDGWWEAFANAVQNGRPPIEHVVERDVPPYPRGLRGTSGARTAALAEKHRRIIQKPRTPRQKFI